MQNKELFDKYFTYEEFDSPDKPGSGRQYMKEEFLSKLARAREIANTPFRITSGYRTQAYHNRLTSKGYATAFNSPHLYG